MRLARLVRRRHFRRILSHDLVFWIKLLQIGLIHGRRSGGRRVCSFDDFLFCLGWCLKFSQRRLVAGCLMRAYIVVEWNLLVLVRGRTL